MAQKRGKRFRAAYEKIDRTHHYEPAEAVALLKQTATARFDETVEVHIRLGVNVRHAEEQLRGTLALPNGAGRDVTVAVFAEGDKAREATEAGAEFVGSDDLAERVEAGWTDFDIVIATPDQMPKVGRLGRILGPQGKMPNPKVMTGGTGPAASARRTCSSCGTTGSGRSSRPNHRRSAALSRSRSTASPTHSVAVKKKSTRCSSAGPPGSPRCRAVSGRRSAGSISTPSSSRASRTAAATTDSPGSTCPAAAAAQNPSRYPVPCRSWSSTSPPRRSST